MAVFKELSPNDVKSAKSFLNQLIDIVQEDISGSVTRKKYQVFVTGGVGPGITSSLFQTVYDQDFSLQTANPVFDLSAGLYFSGSTVQDAKTGEDSAGKLLFPSSSVMMREKVDIYRQAAQNLLGDSTARFKAPIDSIDSNDNIDEALFMGFKRLFARDQIKKETFAVKMYRSASKGGISFDDGDGTNLFETSESGSAIFTDVGSTTNKNVTQGGSVGTIVNSANTSEKVGLLFYDRGFAVLDVKKIISGTQKVSGTIGAMNTAGSQVLGGINTETPGAKFIPDFLTSASIDNIVDHFASCRFSSGSLTAITFQNITNINSTLVFCKAEAPEFNYSSNPTFTDASDKIVVIDDEETQRSFTMLTTVGLYDANDNLLAVAKLSRPVEKNDEKDLTLRIRLDF
jgi:hypothetical protein